MTACSNNEKSMCYFLWISNLCRTSTSNHCKNKELLPLTEKKKRKKELQYESKVYDSVKIYTQWTLVFTSIVLICSGFVALFFCIPSTISSFLLFFVDWRGVVLLLDIGRWCPWAFNVLLTFVDGRGVALLLVIGGRCPWAFSMLLTFVGRMGASLFLGIRGWCSGAFNVRLTFVD